MSDANTNDFQPISTSTPQTTVAEGPATSTAQTLTGIVFEPGPTFEALRTRPRFLIAGLICVVVFTAYYSMFVWRVGSENIARAQITARQPDATPEQIEQGLKIQSSPIVKVITYASFPIVFAVMFAGGAGLYLLGTMMMAKSITFKQALAVWVYASYPPTVVFALINILLLFLKSADDIDPTALNTGIAKANPSFLVDGKAHALLSTFLGSFDLIAFYGLFLAALGLRKVAKLTSGSAWAIVLIIWVVGIVLRLGIAAITGGAS